MATAMTHAPGTVYPSSAWKVVTVVLYVLSLCTLSSMLTRRFPDWRDLRRMNGLQASLVMVLLSA